MKFFTNCNTLDELKKAYKAAALKHHPDCGGDTATMQQVNADYETRFEQLKAAHNSAPENKDRATTETPDEFRDIINKLLKMHGLEIELCGSWLWIGGNTKENKEGLKAAGCRWSNNKKLWYWRHEEDGHRWHRGTKSMDQIRSKYGSTSFNSFGADIQVA